MQYSNTRKNVSDFRTRNVNSLTIDFGFNDESHSGAIVIGTDGNIISGKFSGSTKIVLHVRRNVPAYMTTSQRETIRGILKALTISPKQISISSPVGNLDETINAMYRNILG